MVMMKMVLAELLLALLRLIAAEHCRFQVSCFKFETVVSSDLVIRADWVKTLRFCHHLRKKLY